MNVRHLPFFLLLAACSTFELKRDTSGEPTDTADTGDAAEESADAAAQTATPASLPAPAAPVPVPVPSQKK